MHTRPALSLALALAVAVISSCAPPAEPPVHDKYLLRRSGLAWIDKSQPCRFEKLPPIPVKVIHNRVFLGVKVNNVLTTGVLDTGSNASFITPELAEKARLIRNVRQDDAYNGVSGGFASGSGVLESLQFGSLTYHGTFPIHVLAFGGSHGADLGALIGQDALDGLDYDLDLPHEQIVPYRTANCLAIDPPWPNKVTGLALTRGAASGLRPSLVDMATDFNMRFAVTLPVVFDHGTVQAVLDTGASVSLLSYHGARQAGLTEAEIRNDPVENIVGMNGSKVRLRQHRFSEMVVGEELFRGVQVAVKPEFDRRDTYDMILGTDYIARHHLWLSYTTNALYVDSGEQR